MSKKQRTSLNIIKSMSGGSSVSTISQSECIGLFQYLSGSIIVKTQSKNTLVVYMVENNIQPTKLITVLPHYAIGTSIKINGPPTDASYHIPYPINVFSIQNNPTEQNLFSASLSSGVI